jgi:hypothetical protein
MPKRDNLHVIEPFESEVWNNGILGLSKRVRVGPQDGDPPDVPGDHDELHWDKTGLLHGGSGVDNEFTKPGAIGDPYNETLKVPVMPAQVQSCGQKCAEQDRLAREHCNVIRQRVAAWMKDSGCPSSVRGFKKRAKASCGSTKKVAAKVATKSKSRVAPVAKPRGGGVKCKGGKCFRV